MRSGKLLRVRTNNALVWAAAGIPVAALLYIKKRGDPTYQITSGIVRKQMPQSTPRLYHGIRIHAMPLLFFAQFPIVLLTQMGMLVIIKRNYSS